MAFKVDVKFGARPLKISVWDKRASNVIGTLLKREIRNQARRGASGVDGPFPTGAAGQRIDLTDTGEMLNTLETVESTNTGVTVAPTVEYAKFVDAQYPFMGYSNQTDIAVLEKAREQSGKAFKRSSKHEGTQITVDAEGRGRDGAT